MFHSFLGTRFNVLSVETGEDSIQSYSGCKIPV